VVARPSTWLLLAAYVAGAIRIGGILRTGFADFPIATTTAVALFTLYAIPFILFVRMIDYLEREPVPLQVLSVLWGGLVATSAAISGGTAVQDLMAKFGSPRFAADWGPAVSGAVVEELVKVAGVLTIALIAPGHINSVVDGFVYGALVGLGFQVVEDVVFAVNAVIVDTGADAVGPVISTFLVRGFLGGLWSHTLFTAVAGAGVAYALVRRDRPRLQRIMVMVALFLVAAGFHFLWNSPLLMGLGLGLLGMILTLLVKGIPALLVGAILLLVAERREADYYGGMLAGLGDHRIATSDEIANLLSPRRRLAARRQARIRLGAQGARAIGRLQRAQAQLAVAISRDPGAEVLRRRRDVLVRRHQLIALGIRGNVRRSPGLPDSAILAAEILALSLVVLAVALAIRLLTP
jgi:RsiW-degrading membrane proteinase PrsW (M82 family)